MHIPTNIASKNSKYCVTTGGTAKIGIQTPKGRARDGIKRNISLCKHSSTALVCLKPLLGISQLSLGYLAISKRNEVMEQDFSYIPCWILAKRDRSNSLNELKWNENEMKLFLFLVKTNAKIVATLYQWTIRSLLCLRSVQWQSSRVVTYLGEKNLSSDQTIQYLTQHLI